VTRYCYSSPAHVPSDIPTDLDARPAKRGNMGAAQPYMYDKPSTYTFGSPTSRPFNPRAATQASWTPPAPKFKQDGPLIDFNRHPDSVRDLTEPFLMFALTTPSTSNHLTATSMSRL